MGRKVKWKLFRHSGAEIETYNQETMEWKSGHKAVKQWESLMKVAEKGQGSDRQYLFQTTQDYHWSVFIQTLTFH